MPEIHRLLGAFGEIEPNAFGLKQRQDGSARANWRTQAESLMLILSSLMSALLRK
jgi:hypothetical protein